MTDRIPTHVWLEAKIRELNAGHKPAYVIHKGDLAGGLVLVKISDLSGQCRLLTQQRDLKGDLQWVPALKDDISDEKSADEYIARASSRDPDLWVIEVEDRTIENPFARPE